MSRYKPVNSTATVNLGVFSTAHYNGTIPFVAKTNYSDQAVISLVTTSTRWGPITVRTVNNTDNY